MARSRHQLVQNEHWQFSRQGKKPSSIFCNIFVAAAREPGRLSLSRFEKWLHLLRRANNDLLNIDTHLSETSSFAIILQSHVGNFTHKSLRWLNCRWDLISKAERRRSCTETTFSQLLSNCWNHWNYLKSQMKKWGSTKARPRHTQRHKLGSGLKRSTSRPD